MSASPPLRSAMAEPPVNGDSIQPPEETQCADAEETAPPLAVVSPTAATSPKVKRRSKKGMKLAEDGGGEKGEEEETEALSRCLVYCRLRPTVKNDYKAGGHTLVALEDRCVSLKNEHHYNFDGTFGELSEQSEIFDTVAVPCIDHAFHGFCSALMCYGQTGTGKSYTMCNTDPQHLGIIPRAAKYIFSTIQSAQARHPTQTFTVQGQFVQIYRDHLGDLMLHDGKDRVEIHYEEGKGVSLQGCTSHKLTSAKDFMRFYNEGNARRVIGSTAMNAESSRGHTAMILHITAEDTENIREGKLCGKVTFIDLAGYERFSKTGITGDDPIQKDEAKTINASLLALGHVVSSLSGGSRHIPWRNSKLTRILQDSIGGRSRTSIILTVGPSSEHLFETTNTLQFGLRAMAVKVEAKVSVTVDYVKLAKKLMGLLSERDERISTLEVQIASRDAERQELLERYQRDRGDVEQRYTAELVQLTASGASEGQIQNLKEVYEAEIENLAEQQQEELGYQDEMYSKEIRKLITEQKHQEAKSLTEMKLAQEQLIEDFQQKLDDARGGTNEDLLRALQQLAEKDAILASRANDTARLHATIDILSGQLRSLGAPAKATIDFPQTYLDISQAEEMRSRLKSEAERHYNKAVDLRTQLDRTAALAQSRMEAVTALQLEVQRLRDQLRQANVEMSESNEKMREWRVELVDREELESLRLLMQMDIDELRSQRDELQAEVRRVNAARAREAMSRRRGMLSGDDITPVPLLDGGVEDDGVGEANAEEGGIKVGANVSGLGMLGRGSGESVMGLKMKAMQKAYRTTMQRLNEQLADHNRERTGLLQRLHQMKGILSRHGISPPATPTSAGEDMASVRKSGVLSEEENGTAHPTAPDDGGGADIPLEGALLATNRTDVVPMLLLKEQEIEVRDNLVTQLHEHLCRAFSTRQKDESRIRALQEELERAGLRVPDPSGDAAQPVESVPLEEYSSVLRQLRSHNRRLLVELLLAQSNREGATADTSSTYQAKLDESLAEKDTELELKDEILLEKNALLQYMATLSIRLANQLESLGHQPCCHIPNCYEELAKAEKDQLSIQAEKQMELELQLRREQDEKKKFKRLLEAMNTEREKLAVVHRQELKRSDELRQSESTAALKEMNEALVEKLLHNKEELQRTAHALMELQARTANAPHYGKGIVSFMIDIFR